MHLKNVLQNTKENCNYIIADVTQHETNVRFIADYALCMTFN